MTGFVPVCSLDRLIPERGAAVLVAGRQIALFRVAVGSGEVVYAVGHHDPFSGANVIARGIVGSAGDRDTVASPMYKHVFELATGECLTDPSGSLPVYRTQVRDGFVLVDPEPLSAPVVLPEEQPIQVSA